MFTKQLKIVLEEVALPADINVPENSSGLVIFSHGSGSSRLSKRNLQVAEVLWKKNIGTILFDLLTEEEDLVYENRFDIPLITDRLVHVTDWAMGQEFSKNLSIGYFGASTGAASALRAAAKLKTKIKAVVSRGGRPDLAMGDLEKVTASVLLIIGSLDEPVIGLNKLAYDHLNTVKKMEIVEGATHLFGEPGKLEEVSDLAAEWFSKYLIPATTDVRVS
ncbi:MAG TPA: alpha/beta hydrolase [Bacteroidia bacterium]|nr:alpha/beta hydrolase [Bacteroidia bacterium]